MEGDPMEKIIFEKTYPKRHREIPSLYKRRSGERGMPALDGLLKRIEEDYTCVLIPERQRAMQSLIRLARKISECYKLDIKITEHDTHISIYCYFSAAGGMGFLRELLAGADDISFFSHVNGHEIVMCLDYDTHAVFHKNRRLYP